MAEKKLIDLELLKRYHGQSLAEINRIITEAAEVSVSDTAPTNEGAKLWINTSESNEISIPEINDTATSSSDTWSSEKINNTIEESITTAINDNLVTESDIDAMFEGATV
ncbi:MAG: hypothetical protein J6A19_14665 [Oscillospiraceae bacterium]|nr:hypothetical protein [Oscillospiraceae bacterium]